MVDSDAGSGIQIDCIGLMKFQEVDVKPAFGVTDEMKERGSGGEIVEAGLERELYSMNFGQQIDDVDAPNQMSSHFSGRFFSCLC